MTAESDLTKAEVGYRIFFGIPANQTLEQGDYLLIKWFLTFYEKVVDDEEESNRSLLSTKPTSIPISE